METEISILHFNDVYHLHDVELIARFASLIRSFKPRPLVIFSGDGFSPSLEASVLKGEHMVPILNHLGIDVACYGNHDFDFGEKRLEELSQQVDFPWVLSNVARLQEDGNGDSSSKAIARGERYIIQTVQGYRIGFIGLAGTDWSSNCDNLPPIEIKDPGLVAQNLARHLRLNEGCDFVIAITHMRLAEDIRTANATADGLTKVDLILAGHDHEVLHRFAGDTEDDTEVIQQGSRNEDLVRDGVVEASGDIRIVQSGTNWRGLSIVRLMAQRLSDGQASIASVQLKQYIDTKSSSEFSALPECPEIHTIASLVQQRIGTLVQQPLMHTHSPLDGRGTVVRSSETNLGNMLADASRAYYGTDIALINSGSIRCDRIIEPALSPLRVKDVIEICPFENPLMVKRVSGRALHTALENSLSDLHVDGRFMQCAGLRVLGDWSRGEGRRVPELSLVASPLAAPEPIVPSQMYTVVMSSFIAAGFDGYSCFVEEETLISEEAAVTDSGLLLEIFGYNMQDPASHTITAGDEILHRDIERARRVIIVGTHEPDGLPLVNPSLDGRITFVG